MSSSTSHTSDLSLSAENADWRKEVDALLEYLTSRAPRILSSLLPANDKSIRALIEEGPLLLDKIQELERLQQGRLDRITRGETLADLDRRVEERQEKVRRLEQDLTSLVHQRMDARDKLKADKEASGRHAQQTRHEDLRLDGRVAALDTRQQQLESREAALAMSNQTLSLDIQDLAKGQEVERQREEENKKKSAKIIRRMDILADYKETKDREVAALTSRCEALELEGNGLKIAKKGLEKRAGNLQSQLDTSNIEKEQLIKSNDERLARVTGLEAQIRVNNVKLVNAEASQRQSTNEVAGLKSVVTRLERTIENQNTMLGSLNDRENEVANLTSGLTHLTSVILPQKQADVSKLKAELARERELATTCKSESASRISGLNMKKLELEGSIHGQNTQLSQLRQEKASLQAVANTSTTEAESAKMQLADAQARIDSLNTAWDDNQILIIKNAELKEAAAALKQENDELIARRINDENAKRLQDTIISEIEGLRQERDGLRRERDDLEQELNGLQQQHNGLQQERDGFQQERDRFQQERNRLQQERDKLQRSVHRLRDEARTDAESYNTSLADKDDIIDDLHGRVTSIEKERDDLNDECNRLFEENEGLTAEVARLSEDNGILVENRQHLRREFDEANANLDRLNARLQSCHCSDETASRKRNHRQMESDGDEASSAGHSDRIVRRMGKASELSVAGPSIAGNLVERLAKQGGVSSRWQGLTTEPASVDRSEGRHDLNAGPSTAPRSNIGHPRQPLVLQSGTKWRIEEVLNKDSIAHPIPEAVLAKLRGQIEMWDGGNSAIKQRWRKGGDNGERKCAHSVFRKRKSAWENGDSHQACLNCRETRRLCVVAENGRIELLPLRRDQTSCSLGDENYWLEPMTE